ncbi:hypothetical protein [Bradyrhizobium sp. USDA 4353]
MAAAPAIAPNAMPPAAPASARRRDVVEEAGGEVVAAVMMRLQSGLGLDMSSVNIIGPNMITVNIDLR